MEECVRPVLPQWGRGTSGGWKDVHGPVIVTSPLCWGTRIKRAEDS